MQTNIILFKDFEVNKAYVFQVISDEKTSEPTNSHFNSGS